MAFISPYADWHYKKAEFFGMGTVRAGRGEMRAKEKARSISPQDRAVNKVCPEQGYFKEPRKTLLGRKVTVFVALILISCPVRGFRPLRALRW